ncbi:pyruvate oxidase [Nitrospira sp.]|nr:pyruvate oxidase [Nitrospira sp.]
MTLADQLVARLEQWGVRVVFSLPGDGINGLYEALRKRAETIRLVQVRHEEAAALAACAYAKFTQRLGVCVATSGPGGVHLLNGLYDAKFDGQPVLAITGHTFHDLIGTRYQQDLDLDKLFMDVAAYSVRITSPSHVLSVVDQAIKTAIARRTVTHVTIPKDVQSWDADERSPMNVPSHSGRVYADPQPLPPLPLLEQAAEIVRAGSKIAILAGSGCLNARDEIQALARRLHAPIVKALLGKAVVPDDDPYTTGGVGLLGTAPSQEVLRECDTLIIAGSSFPYLEFYPKPGQARAIQIDLDASRIGLRYPVSVGLVGKCRDVLRAWLPLLEPKTDTTFLYRAQSQMRDWNQLMQTRSGRKDHPLKPQVVIEKVNRFLRDDAIVCCDTGTVTTWVARHLRMRGDMAFSASGTLATMGNGLPYALGAAIGHPGRQVVCICGDGGFTMMMGELATLVKYQLPVKVIIIKNNLLGMIKWEQLGMEGNPEYGVALQPIDFASFASACGAAGYSVDAPSRLDNVLRKAFNEPGPALVEALVDPAEPPLPGTVSMQQAWTFAKAMAKGQHDRLTLMETLVENKVREVI